MKNVTHQSIDRQPKKGTESRVSNEKKSELQGHVLKMKMKWGIRCKQALVDCG